MAYLFRPVLPPGTYSAQWTGNFPGLEVSRGQVVEAKLGGACPLQSPAKAPWEPGLYPHRRHKTCSGRHTHSGALEGVKSINGHG